MADLDPELCSSFLDEAKELIESAEQCFLDIEKAHDNPAAFDQILRIAHNIKGSAGAVGFSDLSKFTHRLESVLLRLKNADCTVRKTIISLLLHCVDFVKSSIASLRSDPSANVRNEELTRRLEAILVCNMCKNEKLLPGSVSGAGPCGFVHQSSTDEPPLSTETIGTLTQTTRQASNRKPVVSADDSIRVGLGRIDKLMNNVGELVILQTGLSQTRHLLQSSMQLATVNQMDKIIREIQEITMSLRMVPLAQTFQKMHRIVRDTSQALSKDVELNVSGEDIELDKSVLEQLSDPLVHLLRNAVDHGLETSDERLAKGKPPKGRISLSAQHSGGRIIIEVQDDGKGLDPKKLVAKAIEKGIVRHEDKLTDDQAYQLIFAPGFSTKEQVTNTSGRGVGMDVVKTNVTALQGEINIETTLGKGTAFRISLPLTLAIVEGMVVRLGVERYVLPIIQISETIQIKNDQISIVGETGRILKLRDDNIPVRSLGQILGHGNRSADARESVGVIVHDSAQTAHCVLVDQIIGQQQVVIKQLGDEIHWLAGVMGAAILGDGEAVLILDIQDLLRSHSQRQRAFRSNSTCRQKTQSKEAV